jgi:hypothetical protein
LIFLDMDGVIADFFTTALRTHGREDLILNWPGGYDMCGPMGIDAKELFEPLDAEWWATLPKFPWSDELIRHCDIILSTPTDHAACYYGKKLWCEHHAPNKPLYLAHNKWYMAQWGRVLIDDSEHNIQLWEENGGRGILFPAPYNRLKGVTDPLEYVMEALS